MKDLVELFDDPLRLADWENEEHGYEHQEKVNGIIHRSESLSDFELEPSAEITDEGIIDFTIGGR